MARTYANSWSHAAAGLTALSHTRASAFRWGVVTLLTLMWIGGGLYYWRDQPASEAVYRTISAVAMWESYFYDAARADTQPMLRELVRFAALAAPVVGLIFAFSGQLGRALARIFNLGAARHVVIAGDSAPALSLALDCATKHDDAVILLSQNLPGETALDLRRKGVTVLEGEAASVETLRTARAHHAAHVVAFEDDDTSNLQTEAAVRRLVGAGKRRPPIGIHVATRSSMLLREAREMRSVQARREGDGKAASVDSKPFSLDEIAARDLIQKEAQTMLTLAARRGQDRVHVAFFGFDDAAEAVAAALLKSLWSAKFAPPRLTVLAPNRERVEARFHARHREAFAYPELWVADVAFMEFDWEARSVGDDLLDAVEAQRGKPTAAVVSTGADPGNIHLAIALKRACNHGLRWPIPIYMRETCESEFSKEYARGDDTEEFDAYLQAFGAHQSTATRARILDGWLDRGAAVAHEHYSKNLGARAMNMRELQAATRDWAGVLETYRAANRAVADSCMVKMWDAGWRPLKAEKGAEKGETAPAVPGAMLDAMAKCEHDRWVAERLMSGWRPAPARKNELMMHDKLIGWDQLSEEDRQKDRTQVLAAIDIARMMSPNGFAAL